MVGGGGDAIERRAAAAMTTTTAETSADALVVQPRPPPPPPAMNGASERRAAAAAMTTTTSTTTAKPRTQPPRSEALSYATFYVAGLAVLAPWNALITCSDVWESYYPGKNVPRLLTACYLPVTLLLMGVLLLLSHERTFPRARAVGGLAVFAVLVSVVPAWDAVAAAGEGTQTGANTIPASALLTIAVLIGIVDGLSQPAIYGEAALLPSRFTQAVCAGTAASGALTSFIRIITKVAFDNNNGKEGSSSAAAGGTKALTAFFGASAVECAAAAVLFACVLPKTRAARSLAAGHAEARASLLRKSSKGEVEMPAMVPSSSSSPKEATTIATPATKEDDFEGEDTSTDSTTTTEAQGLAAASRHPPPSRARVARQMWPCAAAMVVIYGVTISLFPAAFSDVNIDGGSGWFFVGVAALFNVCDLIGKSLPAFAVIAKIAIPRPKMILFYSCCRVVFVPALIFAAKATPQATTAGLVSAVSALLGLSNGYLTVCAFMTASEGLHGRDAEDAGTATVFALVAGLVVGSAASFLFLLK